MRILLAQNALYIPTFGGANKGTRVVIEGLAERGHVCQAVVRAQLDQSARSMPQLLQELECRNIPVTRASQDVVVFEHRGVEIHAVVNGLRLPAYAADQMKKFDPDWALVASEDPGQMVLAACLPKAVYFCQTTMMLPFGPGAAISIPQGRDRIRRTPGVISCCHYLREYMLRWGGIDSVVLRPPVYPSGPYPRFGSHDCGFVTMVNPCALKGIDIFAALAENLPDIKFAAVLTWGTTAADKDRLRRLRNVRLLDPVDDLRELLKQTRVLLMPSVWAEAGAYVCIEAMLYGIPVLASDVGGLPEAKLGVDYVLPVRPIERYERRLDDRQLPIPVVPEQDCAAWLTALRGILENPKIYEDVAERSQAAASALVSTLGVEHFETFLENLGASCRVGVS